jgi:hypothetical protein
MSSPVEVPGCEAYREYLFSYLRDQQIWHTLRFWNAALFYALQKDKVPKPKLENARKCSSSFQLKTVEEGKDVLANKEALMMREPSRSISENSLSSSSSTDNTKSSDSSKYKARSNKGSRSRSSTIATAGGAAAAAGEDNTFEVDEQKQKDNMAFSHLG